MPFRVTSQSVTRPPMFPAPPSCSVGRSTVGRSVPGRGSCLIPCDG
nr:MAG TPA: hypothetical protein [Caudoviricetes sp.]